MAQQITLKVSKNLGEKLQNPGGKFENPHGKFCGPEKFLNK
jgi:hypothetical protein